jgi:hypothetical protein
MQHLHMVFHLVALFFNIMGPKSWINQMSNPIIHQHPNVRVVYAPLPGEIIQIKLTQCSVKLRIITSSFEQHEG